jgi:hypothetical protein
MACVLELGKPTEGALVDLLRSKLREALDQIDVERMCEVEIDQNFRWVNIEPFQFLLYSSDALLVELGAKTFSIMLANKYTYALPSWTSQLNERLVCLQ